MRFREAALAAILCFAGLSPAVAGDNAYYFVDGLNNKRPLYTSTYLCNQHAYNQSCKALGAKCQGQDLYCLARDCTQFFKAYNGGYRVDVRQSGTGKLVCKYHK